MKTSSMVKLAAGALALAAGAAQADYSLTGTAAYDFGCGSGTVTTGICGGPDTGYLVLANTGSTSFSGSATLSGVAPAQTISLSISGTLAPGETWVFNAGPESSNVGGFNHDDPNPNLGLLFSLSGTAGSSAVSASIYDKDIHSGVVRTNPYGLPVDNYILQGGDPFGRDTGDDFEVTQARGSFVIASTVPEPASVALMLAGLGVVAARRLRRR